MSRVPDPSQAGEESLSVAAELLPGVDLRAARTTRGQFHDVVLVPGLAAVRIARREQAARLLPRRVRLLERLGGLGLPFAVPRPLGEVHEVEGSVAVALSWMDGAAMPAGRGDPAQLRSLVDALACVDVAALADVLDVPHAYAGREGWESLLREEVVPRMPVDLRDEVVRRVDAACALPQVVPTLVHGDLAGDNLRWAPDGRLLGVLDWDLASAFDPAVDAACLAWHGWDTVAAAVDDDVLARARTWFDTFAVEQVAAALADGEPEVVVQEYAARAADRLRRDLEL